MGHLIKTHKLKVTRPEFLLRLMGGDPYALDESEMKKSLYTTNSLCYCVYTVLMEADIDPKEIASMHNDGESIAITFKSKSEAKRVQELCHKETVRYGSSTYKVKMKVRDKHLVATVEKVVEDEEEYGDND